MNIIENFGGSLQAIEKQYQEISKDDEIGSRIFNTVCGYAEKVNLSDQKKIDALLSPLDLGEKLAINSMIGTVNFNLQYALAVTNTNLEQYDDTSLEDLITTHKFVNIKSARCYYNLKLAKELSERSDYNDYDKYLYLDKKLAYQGNY